MSIWFLALLFFCVVNEISSYDSDVLSDENILKMIKYELSHTNLNDKNVHEKLDVEMFFKMIKENISYTNEDAIINLNILNDENILKMIKNEIPYTNFKNEEKLKNLNVEQVLEKIKQEWPFIMLTKEIYFTNIILEVLKRNDLLVREFGSLNLFVTFMCENMDNTLEQLKIYFVPPSDDITGVLVRERIIRLFLIKYHVSNNIRMKEPEEWIKYTSVRPTLLKEYQRRYFIMKKIYNISRNEIIGLTDNTLINRYWYDWQKNN
ncbi:uncharacterized protein LOC126896160 isoform X5 [Daktulosphaira vitifoliae]|uniref:uncharacterized protein LOC126896160 isoform X5 n=1 Tax=Daktulosphaira vitifoliae TaxID=58002 RepID=UPI0021AA1DC7|nr:uncharacterized protein LOC126896160 isoform X5 [Daktulosphaira vitifoliae]